MKEEERKKGKKMKGWVEEREREERKGGEGGRKRGKEREKGRM